MPKITTKAHSEASNQKTNQEVQEEKETWHYKESNKRRPLHNQNKVNAGKVVHHCLIHEQVKMEVFQPR